MSSRRAATLIDARRSFNYGVNAKLWITTSTSCPFVGGAPPTSQRFSRTVSSPGFGAAPTYDQLWLQPSDAALAKSTAAERQVNPCAVVRAPASVAKRCRCPARSYGWTTYWAFVGSAAFPQRENSTSISRWLY